MSDRFRFRVFDKERNDYVDDSEVELILHNDGVLLFGNWHEDIKVVEQDKYIVEQCTGVRDKNGKLVYEGDIVSNGYKTGVVKYGKFNCSCCDGVYGWYFDDADIRDVESYEIIGNIHEQAEQKDK